MMMRLYEPLTGKITLDGVDVSRMSVQFLRSIIGLVQQEPVQCNVPPRVQLCRSRIGSGSLFVDSER
jgi:ABC-type transport system involved in Fe-S cluster assembly fused permease/ATPase subunit